MQEQSHAVGLNALIQDSLENPQKDIYRIGDLAKEFDITLRALRFYEDRGLLSPKRAGATRLYSSDDRQRLKLILLAKRFGFSLVDIQEILNAHDADTMSHENLLQVVSKFKNQVNVLDEQSRELEHAKEELKDSISYLEKLL